MYLPSATYRVQLHHQFTLHDLKKIIDYLERLGISTVYASPIFTAVPGSLHGYDLCDPHSINSQIGSESELSGIVQQLKQKNMGWLQDIVPNHMAFDTHNAFLMDVLERGPHSPYSNYFDINWNHPDPELKEKLLLPFLGSDVNECLSKNEIVLRFGEYGFTIHYFDNSWPVSVSAYGLLLPVIEEISVNKGRVAAEKLVQQLTDLQEMAESGIDKKEWESAKEHWLVQAIEDKDLNQSIQENVQGVNDDPMWLKEILDKQFYRLAYWRTTEKKIDYRRFFTVNGLICLRMEDKQVFDEYHQYIVRLYEKNYFQGLRIDHIDGLYDPANYIQRLRRSVGDDCYIISEKILAPNEELPSDWELQGTSGYEFLSHVNRLLTNTDGARHLLNYYKEAIGVGKPYEDIVFEKKLYILLAHMQGELNNLVDYLHELDLLPNDSIKDEDIKESLAAFMAAFPVYRIYPDAFPLEEIEFVEHAFQFALAKKPANRKSLEWIRSLFEWKRKSIDEDTAEMLFLKRLMQFTGPLAAKGVEDTTFYFYNPLISHNEVGDAPTRLAITSNAFHRQMLRRQEKTPFSLNATSTHDTKRGEDARMRINVLSEMSHQWISMVQEWMKMNAHLKITVNGMTVPSINEEYFIYQSMIGGFPANLSINTEDVDRLRDYVQKFLREEKQSTDWAEPDEEYEKACFAFIDKLMSKEHEFIYSFVEFERKIISYASIYSLAQALIKVAAPGIPDIYQGTELWDLSYVDPDNRRPVDYETRIQLLDSIRAMEQKGDIVGLLTYISQKREEGLEKLYVLYKSLHFRKNHADLFHFGEYVPISISGGKDDAVAFVRRWKDEWVMVVVPLNVVGKVNESNNRIDASQWNDIQLELPEGSPTTWKNIFTGEEVSIERTRLLSDIVSSFPVALLHTNTKD